MVFPFTILSIANFSPENDGVLILIIELRLYDSYLTSINSLFSNLRFSIPEQIPLSFVHVLLCFVSFGIVYFPLNVVQPSFLGSACGTRCSVLVANRILLLFTCNGSVWPYAEST